MHEKNGMTSRSRRLLKIMLAGLLLCSLAGSVVFALQTRTVNDGIYTDQQAMRGDALYQKRCLACHGANLAGRTGPPLTGEDFLANWGAQPLLELANKIAKTMPRDDTDPLKPQEAADVLAYILQMGKFPSGRAELALNEAALKNVTFPGRTAPPREGRSGAAFVAAGFRQSCPGHARDAVSERQPSFQRSEYGSRS